MEPKSQSIPKLRIGIEFVTEGLAEAKIAGREIFLRDDGLEAVRDLKEKYVAGLRMIEIGLDRIQRASLPEFRGDKPWRIQSASAGRPTQDRIVELLLMAGNDGIEQSEIVSRLGVSRNNISSYLAQAELKDWVTREKSGKRNGLCRATDKLISLVRSADNNSLERSDEPRAH